jgi:hypothetical protein
MMPVAFKALEKTPLTKVASSLERVEEMLVPEAVVALRVTSGMRRPWRVVLRKET